jgi:L-arabinokinase
MKRPIVYYISSHGYGHGTRSADIIGALNQEFPDQPIIAVSKLPLEFLRARMPSEVTQFRAGVFDVGLIQSDSIRADLDATFEAIEQLFEQEAELVEQEAAFLKECNAAVVVTDIAAIPILSAKQLGLPVIAVGNFSWDWIYAELKQERWQPYVDRFAVAYAQSDLLLRLPFACPMPAFPHALDVPLLSEQFEPDRDALAKITGADPSKLWVLISLVQVEWDIEALRIIEALSDYEFFTVRPLDFPWTSLHCIGRHQMHFPQILASCDVVVTKPGFGIVSECIANEKPMIYTDRKHFAEYDYLVRDIKRYLKNVHIPSAAFYRGELGSALEAVRRASDPSEKIASHGARFAAEQIVQMIGV